MTVIDTVAVLESALPSFALNVNESDPLNPAPASKLPPPCPPPPTRRGAGWVRCGRRCGARRIGCRRRRRRTRGRCPRPRRSADRPRRRRRRGTDHGWAARRRRPVAGCCRRSRRRTGGSRTCRSRARCSSPSAASLAASSRAVTEAPSPSAISTLPRSSASLLELVDGALRRLHLEVGVELRAHPLDDVDRRLRTCTARSRCSSPTSEASSKCSGRMPATSRSGRRSPMRSCTSSGSRNVAIGSDSVVAVELGGQQVHGRRADEAGDEQVGRARCRARLGVPTCWT